MPTAPPMFRPHGRERRARDQDRGSARERGYSTRWDRLSRDWRRRHPLCVGCDAVGLVAAVEVTDHIVPHRGDHELMFDRANLQSACKWHHDVVKQRLEARWAAGEIGAGDLRLDGQAAIALTRLLMP